MIKFNKLLNKVAFVFLLIFAQLKYNIQINQTVIGLSYL